jgi:hypothetical protein
MKRNLIEYTTINALALFIMIRAEAYPLNNDGAVAISPEHPQTWAAGADLTNHTLAWNKKEATLDAYIVFRTYEAPDMSNPYEEDTFTMNFPTVHLDPVTHNLTVDGLAIGNVRHTWFGDQAVLKPGYALKVDLHHHGQVTAQIGREYTEDN